MERTYVSDAMRRTGENVLVRGFVDNIRNGKSMAFIVLKDLTGRLQITVEKEKFPGLCPVLDQITPDSVISVDGGPR
ncbi:MAG: OB-fold nucleic acid binding domain-containing protein [Clostridia bacterium]|nr:OB-fold nucleic acid binding domain-containing protein [Clostridia bacterium]